MSSRVVGVFALILLMAACAGATTAPPAPTTTPAAAPSATPAATASATASPDVARHCSFSEFWQLAYRVDGMDAVDVTCSITYKDLGDVEATLDLYLPPDTAPGDRLPAIVLVHGNDGLSNPLQPITEHWERDMYTHGLVVAASGMAGVAFSYRGYRASDAEALAAAQQAVLDLLTYIESHADELMIDPQRVCIWTTSGGAIPGAWAALFGEPRPRCAVVFSGTLEAPAEEVSPAKQVSSESPPFFIAGGALDGYHRVTTFVDRATAVGADVTVREHPGGASAHFEQTEDPESAAIIAEALGFIADHVGQ